MANSSIRFLEFPAEVQIRILAYALKLEVAAGYDASAMMEVTKPKNYNDVVPGQNDPFPIYTLPRPPSLLFINHHIRKTVINMQWRRFILYVFPSTIAMLDVLTLWPKDKLRQISRMRVIGHILPIYKVHQVPGGYQISKKSTTYSLANCLRILQGLELDLLEVYHPYSTSELTYGGRDALRRQIQDLMPSQGWRELHLASEMPNFKCEEVSGMVNWADQIRESEAGPGDADYDFDLPDTAVERDPKTGRIIGLRCQQPGNQEKHKKTFNHAAVEMFEDQLPKTRHLILACKHGTQANIAQNDNLSGPLGMILSDFTWQDLRRSDKIFRKDFTKLSDMLYSDNGW